MANATRPSFRDAQYRGLEVGLRVVRRHAEYSAAPMARSSDVYAFMRELRHESAEHLYELLLNSQRELTGLYLVGKGGCRRCTADPMEVYKGALATNSPGFVLVHNHPSGDVQPSAEDMSFARRIHEGSKLLGLDFVDMVIIGDGSYLSFADRQLLGGR